MKLGHGTDWFENLSKYLRATFSSGYDVVLRTGGLNENYIRANLRSVTERFDALTGDPDLHLDTDSARLTMTKGGGALSLNGDRIFAFVSDALRGDAEEVSWTVCPTLTGSPPTSASKPGTPPSRRTSPSSPRSWAATSTSRRLKRHGARPCPAPRWSSPCA